MYNCLLIDGNNLAWRAGSVLFLKNSEGDNTSALYGMLNMIRTLIETFQPKEVCVCWDLKSSVSKQKIFPEYKENRKSRDIPEFIVAEIISQIKKLQGILSAFAIKQVVSEGIEADDVLAVLAEAIPNSLIVSADKDMLQLVEFGHHVYSPFKDLVLTKDNFESNYYIKPELYLFLRTIVGDPSDGIPGLRGIGDVTAKKLLKRYGNWLDWFDGDYVKYSILCDVNKAQRVTLQNHAKEILVRNYYIMKLGYLLTEDEVRDILNKYEIQDNPSINDDLIKSFFLDNQFASYLARYNGWIHPFLRFLTRNEIKGENL